MNFNKYTKLTLGIATGMASLTGGANTQPPKPNILFCIADDASMNSFGAYGNKFIKTPAIDDLAKKGVKFTNAYNCNPKCAPARACIVTGRYSWQLKAACNHWPHFSSEFQCYPQLLMDKGYFVGYTGKGWSPGIYDTKYNPAGPAFNKKKSKPPYRKMSWINYAANFKLFLKKKPKGEPFCFWLGTLEPHRGYEKGAWKKAKRKLHETDVPPYYPDNATIRGDLLDYANEVEWFDTHVGRAIKILEKKGLLDNTLIIITSDHGMPFPRIKGQIYEEGFHVPMIAYWKGVILPGRVVNDFVNFPDIAPTFMKVAGFKPTEQMSGKSFLDILRSTKSGQIDENRTYALLGKERHDIGRVSKEGSDLTYPVRAIRTKDFLYAHNIKPDRWPTGNPGWGFLNCDGGPTKTYITSIKPNSSEYHYFKINFGKRPEEELYKMPEDIHCMKNLASDPKYSEIKQKLRKKMEAELLKQNDPRTLGKGAIFNKYKYTGPR